MKRVRYVYLARALGENSRYIYATFFNKRIAEKAVKEAGGGEVFAMESRAFHDPSCIYGWDARTFEICSAFNWSVAGC